MSATLDREKLLEALYRAAFEIEDGVNEAAEPEADKYLLMTRAWRIVAVGIEEGEFDAPEPALLETAACPRCGKYLRAPAGYDPLKGGCPWCGWGEGGPDDEQT